jgi:hypothetical protein
LNAANDFMPWDDWQPRMRQFAIYDMEISATNAASSYTDQNLARARLWVGSLHELQRLVWPFQNHRAHRLALP